MKPVWSVRSSNACERIGGKLTSKARKVERTGVQFFKAVEVSTEGHGARLARAQCKAMHPRAPLAKPRGADRSTQWMELSPEGYGPTKSEGAPEGRSARRQVTCHRKVP